MPDLRPDPLATPVQFCRGVGPQRAALLEKLEVFTALDLLLHLPRDVLDLTNTRPVHELQEKELQSVVGVVVDRDSKMTSQGKALTAVLLQADGGFVRGVWFNQSYMLAKFQEGQRVVFSGKPKFRDRRWEFSHPHVQWLGEDDDETGGGVLPKYGLTDGLKQHELRRLIRLAVDDFAALLADRWPEPLRLQLATPHLSEAVTLIHCPKSRADFEQGHRRLLLEEILDFQVGLALRKRYWTKSHQSVPIPVSAKVDARIRRLFSFRFTNGQEKAIAEITQDLARPNAMHRLLQADVGAGKTAVAIYALLAVIAAGGQGVFLAPTEVLARQHWQTLDRLLQDSRVSRRLLVGDLTAAERRETLEGIASGQVQLIIGTQAIIQDSVQFANLRLAVIDEQHKFGVRQRARFSAANQVSPHVLVMTATPIPRSLCLTQFGDLDLSIIDELPPGRARVVTSRITTSAAAAKMWQFVRQQLDAGRQAYIVCPRVGEVREEGDEELPSEDVPTAEQTFARLRSQELKDYRLGLVHGRLERERKHAEMEAFRNGETQVLVGTTVIEVGIDVANASVMIITHAESFGLSQLHQLRGRIGRGRHLGYCFVLSESVQPEIVRRLAAFESLADGFQLSEVDLEIRGAGDVLGLRQSGTQPFRTADPVRDQKLFEEARGVAFSLVTSQQIDGADYAPLKLRVLDRYGRLMDLPHTG